MLRPYQINLSNQPLQGILFLFLSAYLINING